MSDDYIHGFSPEEQARLTRMQDILNHRELEQLDLRGVSSILDVGAGLGQMTRALARAAGPGTRVVGIERDERQRAEAMRQAREAGEDALMELRPGDATDLPLTDDERKSFDLVHARFLLEHVTHPEQVVREMVSAARPGGRVVLFDDDHDLLRLWPGCPGVEQAWRAYWESYADHGCDPLVGRRLAALLSAAGCATVRTTAVFYGATIGEPLFPLVVDNLRGVLAGAADALDAAGRLPRADLESELAELDAWRSQPGATLWYSLPLAEGIVPK